MIALLIAVPSASSVTAPPYSTSTGGFPQGKAQCGVVSGINFASPETPSQAQVVQVRAISCSAARQVVKQCIGSRNVKGWHASALSFTATLSSGRKRIQVRLVSGPPPLCLRGHSLTKGRATGEFGPFEQPLSFPSTWPAPYKIVYQWTTPVTSFSATIFRTSVSTVNLLGYGHNRDGKMRSFWFQYGKTRDLGSETEKQNPPTTTDDAPIPFSARLLHLRAQTRYFWQAAASFDQPDGSVKTMYGTLGTFVTKPYPKIKTPSVRVTPTRPASALERRSS